jgi:PAS domain S-box-containing protein
MSIRSRLIIIFMMVVSIPLLLVSELTYSNFKKSLEANRFAQLNDLCVFRADRIEDYFAGLKADMEIAQGFYIIKKNLSVLNRASDKEDNPEFIAYKKALGTQLEHMQAVSDMSDIMLVLPGGKVVYSNRAAHALKDMTKGLDVERAAFEHGKREVFFSDIFFDKDEDKRFEMLVTAPATDFDGVFRGVIAFEVDMTPVYKIIQDVTGLGSTGEVLVGKKTGNQVEFLNPLRHDPKAALSRKATLGERTAFPIQQAVEGRTGSGVAIDYRGQQVIAAWRYIPSRDWGLVAKIDTHEAFADITKLRNLVLIILLIVFVLSSVMAFSIAQSISRPITVLMKGAEIIGSGNLDHKVGMNLKDEIGRLSRTFDKMTNDLKTTLASRDELNREIEYRKKSEEALRESEERFRVIADASPIQISVGREEDGTILFTNPEYDRAFGFGKGELIGHKTPELYADPAERNKLIKALKEAGALKNYEIQVKKSDGTPFWVSISINRINYSGGPALLATSIDITRRKKIEEALRLAALNLSRSNKDLEQFAYVASHDLQEPLRAVGGFMGLLKNQYYDKLDDQAREYIDFSVDGAERMQGLIEGLLTFSRVGTRGGEFASVNLADALDGARANLKTLIEESNAVVTSDALPIVTADLSQMTQLLQNLVANAVKFHGPHSPEIHVGAQRKERAWEIYVRDNGIGIDPQYFDRIFLIFQRLHTRTQYKGTGIGLAVCKKIVERHGGKIRVESVPGQGATFYFTIPDKGDIA